MVTPAPRAVWLFSTVADGARVSNVHLKARRQRASGNFSFCAAAASSGRHSGSKSDDLCTNAGCSGDPCTSCSFLTSSRCTTIVASLLAHVVKVMRYKAALQRQRRCCLAGYPLYYSIACPTISMLECGPSKSHVQCLKHFLLPLSSSYAKLSATHSVLYTVMP